MSNSKRPKFELTVKSNGADDPRWSVQAKLNDKEKVGLIKRLNYCSVSGPSLEGLLDESGGAAYDALMDVSHALINLWEALVVESK